MEPDIEDPYDCKKCRMSFPTLQDHRKHIHEVHSKEYHPCPTCGKIFSAPSMLERHMVTHVGGKPFSCGICNKAYQVSSASAGTFPGPSSTLPLVSLGPHVCGLQNTSCLQDMTIWLVLVKNAADRLFRSSVVTWSEWGQWGSFNWSQEFLHFFS